jgi:hypothetical protein
MRYVRVLCAVDWVNPPGAQVGHVILGLTADEFLVRARGGQNMSSFVNQRILNKHLTVTAGIDARILEAVTRDPLPAAGY